MDKLTDKEKITQRQQIQATIVEIAVKEGCIKCRHCGGKGFSPMYFDELDEPHPFGDRCLECTGFGFQAPDGSIITEKVHFIYEKHKTYIIP